MSNEKFTKGPWSFNYPNGWLENENGRIICKVGDDWGHYHDAEPNAALIAAAPEMYEMLKTACGMFSGTEFASRAESLLAKARGGK